jgi:DNA-binding NarL/FixJ family response regulator
MSQASTIKIIIRHSDPLISAGVAAIFREQREFEVAACGPDLTEPGPTQRHFLSQYVVVADYNSGLRLTSSNSAWRDRVMILTHSDSEAMISRALEQGVRGYLLLGCSLKDLVDGLRSVHAGVIALAPVVAGRLADRMKQKALTIREEDILRQIMLGLSNKRIAFQLDLAVGTVKTHVKSILEKLGASSRTEAIAIAQRRGILAEEHEWPHPQIRGARREGHPSLSEPVLNSPKMRSIRRSVEPNAPMSPPAP